MLLTPETFPSSASRLDDWLIPAALCKPHVLSSALPLLTALWSLAGPSQVRGELLWERVQQLEAQEGRFAESLVSLQFQKAARMARTLWAYTALLSIQDLLLEELSASETLTKSACMQILESHSPVSAGPWKERMPTTPHPLVVLSGGCFHLSHHRMGGLPSCLCQGVLGRAE